MAGVSLAIFLVWVFRPYAKADPALTEPSLANLSEPVEVGIAYYLDGGSIGIRIVDSLGTTLDLCVPAPLGEKDDQYQRVFIGALHYTEEGSTEVDNSHHAKLRLAEILRSQPGVDRERDVALACISGRWSDIWRVIRRRYLWRTYDGEGSA